MAEGRGLITLQVAVQVGDLLCKLVSLTECTNRDNTPTEKTFCPKDKRLPPGPLRLEDGSEDHKLAINLVEGLDRNSNNAAGGDDQFDH